MRGSWRMARLAGVNINVHWSFSFIILWVIVQGAVSHRNLEAIIFVLPIGGLAQMQSLPEKPVHEMLIAGAGPLVNLSLVIGLIPVALFFSEEALLWGFFDSPSTVLESV